MAQAAAAGAEGLEEAIQALKTHVTVAVRVRGLDPVNHNLGGGEREDTPAIFPNEADAGRSLVIDGASRGAAAFTFDNVFWSLEDSKRYVAWGMLGSWETCWVIDRLTLMTASIPFPYQPTGNTPRT